MSLKLTDPTKNRPVASTGETSGRKIVFSHKRAFGDELMFTAGIRDFKLLFPDIEVGVEGNHPAIWENNPYINPKLKPGKEVEYYQVGYSGIASANNTYLHFTQMFLLDMVAAVDAHSPLSMSLSEFCASFSNGEVGDPDMGTSKKGNVPREPFISMRQKYRNFCQKFSRMRGDIHLTKEEQEKNIIRDVYGIEEPYWIIAPGGKRDGTTKIWDWRRFNDVLDYFDGRLRFVVIGKGDLLVERFWKRNVIDLVDKFNTDHRGLFSLIHNAAGCVSGPSFLMHASAAIGDGKKPCVTILGGREPTGWTWYTHHQILHTNGVYSCCATGGCWKARTYPLMKDPKHNSNVCRKPVESSGRTIQSCMDVITSNDVMRAINLYYEGDLHSFEKKKSVLVKDFPKPKVLNLRVGDTMKTINLLGNLHVDGGGEQSLCMIARVLMRAGWKPKLFSWSGIHEKIRGMFPDLEGVFQEATFESGMKEAMFPKKPTPLLFYANDRTRDFAEKAEPIVELCSDLIIGINYVNRPLPKCEWLAKSRKVRALVFQNQEKLEEFKKDEIGFEDVRKIAMFGAIDLDKFLEVCPKQRSRKEPLVVLKHCVPDYRKYVTKSSEGKGDKVHIWQKHMSKDRDVKFYKRLLKDVPNVQFEFMKAHEELEGEFRNEDRMVFHEWDSLPVPEFLARGHIYLYRTSNLWRDQYPRGVAEALAAGLPVLSEPRDGTKDRIQHGDTGFHCIDYDGFCYALKLLERKEKYQYAMGQHAKEWAKKNLDPMKWAEVIEEAVDEDSQDRKEAPDHKKMVGR